MKELDKLDTALMHRVNANPGCCIRDAIRPFLLEKSESVLRERVRALELRKRIRTTKTKREVLCYPDNETRIKKIRCYQHRTARTPYHRSKTLGESHEILFFNTI